MPSEVSWPSLLYLQSPHPSLNKILISWLVSLMFAVGGTPFTYICISGSNLGHAFAVSASLR